MKIRIDGRELLVRKTTRGIVDFQRQSGMVLKDMTEAEVSGYATAMAAFFALQNAGFSPNWDDILDRDIEEFQFIEEPGDKKPTAEEATADPQTSHAGSDPGAAAGAKPKATPGSKRSSTPKGGSKTK